MSDWKELRKKKDIYEFNDFKGTKKYQDNSIDILHIDIANNGDVFEFAINNYFKTKKQNVPEINELTERELQVLEFIAKGHLNKEIAH